jgi:hypothetical protein
MLEHDNVHHFNLWVWHRPAFVEKNVFCFTAKTDCGKLVARLAVAMF